jgi:glycosyltransferase involved in cell wall biosynthesis
VTRLLHLHFGKEGGAERFFVALARAFDARGVEQRFVIRPDVSWHDDIAALGPVTHDSARMGLGRNALGRRRVARLARGFRPDAIMAWIPRALRVMPDRTPGPDAPLQLVRLGDFPTDLDHFDRCDVVVGNVPGIGDHCRDLGWGGPVRTISNFPRPVVPRPVDRATLGTPADAFLVATGGRLVHRKGIDAAIRACARLDGAWLWVLGDGRERATLEALAAELGVAARIRFCGWVDEPIHHIAAADAFLMPSRQEPLGNMLLEAWAAGTPSISTRSEGPDWYMRDGVDGRLVEIDDDEAIAAGLAALRDDPALGGRHVEGARARLAEMFTPEGVVDAYLALLDDPSLRN